jgi:hypothetical protein
VPSHASPKAQRPLTDNQIITGLATIIGPTQTFPALLV